MARICKECGVYIRNWKRHMRGYRIKDKSGKIIYTKRCARQHIRKNEKTSKKGTPVPYSQGY